MSRTDLLGMDQPAIVRADIDVDTLLRDAKMFGRNSTESAVKAGELYAQAKEACPHGHWLQKLAKSGESDRTARYLIALYRKHLVKSATIADLTGTAEETAQPVITPPTYAAPLVFCRPCRVSPKPKENCKACKALRGAQPKLFEAEAPALSQKPSPTGDAAEEVPEEVLKDAEGLVLPERVRPYLEDRSIEDWVSKHGRPAFDALKELQARPGASHVDVPLLAKKQSAICRQIKSAKLSHRCSECAGEGCTKCANTGLLSKALWSER